MTSMGMKKHAVELLMLIRNGTVAQPVEEKPFGVVWGNKHCELAANMGVPDVAETCPHAPRW